MEVAVGPRQIKCAIWHDAMEVAVGPKQIKCVIWHVQILKERKIYEEYDYEYRN